MLFRSQLGVKEFSRPPWLLKAELGPGPRSPDSNPTPRGLGAQFNSQSLRKTSFLNLHFPPLPEEDPTGQLLRSLQLQHDQRLPWLGGWPCYRGETEAQSFPELSRRPHTLSPNLMFDEVEVEAAKDEPEPDAEEEVVTFTKSRKPKTLRKNCSRASR